MADRRWVKTETGTARARHHVIPSRPILRRPIPSQHTKSIIFFLFYSKAFLESLAISSGFLSSSNLLILCKLVLFSFKSSLKLSLEKIINTFSLTKFLPILSVLDQVEIILNGHWLTLSPFIFVHEYMNYLNGFEKIRNWKRKKLIREGLFGFEIFFFLWKKYIILKIYIRLYTVSFFNHETKDNEDDISDAVCDFFL